MYVKNAVLVLQSFSSIDIINPFQFSCLKHKTSLSKKFDLHVNIICISDSNIFIF